MKLLWLFSFLCYVSISGILRAQCSDAGVCTLAHRSADQTVDVNVEYAFGKSAKADGLTFHSLAITANIPVLDRSRITLSLPYNTQSGPLGTVSGVGDCSILWTETIYTESDYRVNLSLGGKFALARVNQGALPQAYQSGLGTNDLLIGAGLEFAQLRFSVGYQLSRGRSDNADSRLRRGDDLLLAAGYSLNLGELSASAEVLAIKRLHKSNILVSLSGSPLPFYADVPESDQAQVNLIGRAAYPLSEHVRLRGMLAIPTLKRDVNIDGLTRSIALSLGVNYSL